MSHHALKKVGYVSPSQIATFRDCERKWSYKYVDGLKEPPNRSAQLGTDVHGVLERWFGKGEAPNLMTREGEIAFSGLKHHPKPSSQLRVEHEARFEFDGVQYLGYIDLHYVTVVEGMQVLVVTDHKTTGDYNFRWALTETGLLTDAQRVIYNVWGLIAYRVQVVLSHWVYYRTTPPPATRVVDLLQDADQIWEAFRDVHEDGKAIVAARRRSTADAPRNFDACQAYGGCPFLERCHNNDGRRVSAIDKAKAVFAQGERKEAAARGEVIPLDRGRAKLVVLQGGSERGQKETRAVGLLNRAREEKANSTNGTKPGLDPALAKKAYEDAEKAKAEADAKAAADAEVAAGDVASDDMTGETPKQESPFLANLRNRMNGGKGKVEENAGSSFETENPTDEQRKAAEEADKAKADKAKGTTRTPRAAAATTTAVVAAIDLNSPKLWRGLMHCCAILTGRSPKLAEEHFDTWKNTEG